MTASAPFFHIDASEHHNKSFEQRNKTFESSNKQPDSFKTTQRKLQSSVSLLHQQKAVSSATNFCIWITTWEQFYSAITSWKASFLPGHFFVSSFTILLCLEATIMQWAMLT
jgi:hypothetical protein